jgi:hypothetical protein
MDNTRPKLSIASNRSGFEPRGPGGYPPGLPRIGLTPDKASWMGSHALFNDAWFRRIPPLALTRRGVSDRSGLASWNEEALLAAVIDSAQDECRGELGRISVAPQKLATSFTEC